MFAGKPVPGRGLQADRATIESRFFPMELPGWLVHLIRVLRNLAPRRLLAARCRWVRRSGWGFRPGQGESSKEGCRREGMKARGLRPRRGSNNAFSKGEVSMKKLL